MFRLILLAWIIYILLRWLRRGTAPAPAARTSTPPAEQPVEEMVQDPVCGTWVPAGQALSLPGEKETRYFCSATCREKFLGSQGREK